MKTISEMQLLIKDAYSKLDELSKSLLEYNLSSDKNMDIDFEKLKKIGRRNPIEAHTLCQADQLAKKHYMTLLMALVYLAEENQEKGWLLIQRIACGANVEHELLTLSADCLSLTEKQLDSFSESLIIGNLRTAFALDCMLVYLICEHKNTKMLDFISELLEMVKCTESEVKEITELSSLIATSNTTEYFAKCLTNLSVDLMESLCYIMPTKATVVNSLEVAMKTDKEHVIVFNAVISKLSNQIYFDNFPAKTIEFFHCKFENIVGIKSQNKKVIFKNCHFLNCTASKHLISIQNDNINNCFFEQCFGVDMGSNTYLFEIINGDIKNCKFKDCSIKTDRENRRTTIIGLIKLSQGTIENTKFINCKSYGDSAYGSHAEYSLYILYLSNASAQKCDFVNCQCNSVRCDNSITRDNYIIALKNSTQINNNFTNCFIEQYRGWSTNKSPVGTIE